MANENSKHDGDRVPTTLGLNALGEIRNLRLTEEGFFTPGNALVNEEHDYISLGYTGSNLTSVIYKSGGSGGTTVATLTLAYSGSTLTSVTKT